MLIHTRVLFTALLQAAGADCVCDIGSRDGEDSLRFRLILPKARLLAFEANKYNFQRMQADARLAQAGVEILPYAVSDRLGEARFHITAVSENDPGEVSGTSSLLVSDRVQTTETATVPTRRIDDLICESYPQTKRLGLWIDVEGAECAVVEGMEKIRDRVVALHVETARTAMRQGQRTTDDLCALLDKMGFEICGASFRDDAEWGDMVFINRAVKKELGWKYNRMVWKAKLSYAIGVEKIAGVLRRRLPGFYARAYRTFHRAGA